MSTVNPFDLLGDDDTGDLSLLIQKIDPKKALAASATPAAAQPKLPSKPLPPSQAVKEAKSESARGGRGGRGTGRGRGSYRDFSHNESPHGNREVSGGPGAPNEAGSGRPFERRGGYGGPDERRGGYGGPDERRSGYVGPRGAFRGGQRGGFSNGEAGEGNFDRPRRQFDRRSGTGHGNEIKRDGSGQGNWGTQSDELARVDEEVVYDGEKGLVAEKPSVEENAAVDVDKEVATNEVEEKEPEVKEMTLEEYEKVLEEKRKALQTLKTESRKVDVKEFEAMQQLSNKKTNDEIFVKLGSEKDKKKELAEKEERAKKSVSINEFLKPAEGEKFYNPGGRGRGRGRGSRGGYSGGGTEISSNVKAPAIEDPGQFPTLGGK